MSLILIVLRATSVALAWVRFLPPGPLLSISVQLRLKKKRATLTPAALKLISKGGFPAGNCSLHLQACYLINWDIFQLAGTALNSVSSKAVKICLLSLCYNCSFAWAVLLSQSNLPCFPLHWNNSRPRVLSLDNITHALAPETSLEKPKRKCKARNQLNECLLSSWKEARKEGKLDNKDLSFKSVSWKTVSWFRV